LKKNGKFISAIPIIYGCKSTPLDLPSGGNVQHDNVAMEFATAPAVNCSDWINKISTAFKEIKPFLPEGTQILAVPSADFPDEELQDAEAMQFGCSPDFNAWLDMKNIPPVISETDKMRSFGGHIHVGQVSGYEFLRDPFGKRMVIKTMDAVHGIVSTILDSSKEAIARKRLYGKAGCYRPTSYGVEYRTMSNFWLRSPVLVRLMYSLTEDVLSMIHRQKHQHLISTITPTTIISTINGGKTNIAGQIYKNIIAKNLSKLSTELFNTCLTNISTFDLEKEWA